MSAQTELGLVGVDIGASNIKFALGVQDTKHDVIDIIAISSVPTMGIREGKIINLNALNKAIEEGIERVQKHGQCEIHQVMMSISSRYFYTIDSASTVNISEGRVTHRDVLEAVSSCHEDAKQIQSGQGGYGITHTLAQEYLLDHQVCEGAPWSKPALHLGLKAHLVYGHRDTMNSIWRLQDELPAPLRDVVLDLLVQSEGLINHNNPPEYKAILDIGSETTKILLLHYGRPMWMFNRLQGGVHLTNEIQRQLKIRDFHDAEELKTKHGRVYVDAHAHKNSRIALDTDGPQRHIRQESLARILERALTENLSALRVRLEEAGVAHMLKGGVLLTGGTANIPEICTLTGDILQTKVTLGIPQQSGVKDLVQAPQYAAVNGLVVAGFKRSYDQWFSIWRRELMEIPYPFSRVSDTQHSLWSRLRSMMS